MRPLQPPPSLPIEVYDRIAGSKLRASRRRLEALRGGVERAFNSYVIDRLPTLRPLTITTEDRAHLLGCYDSSTKPLEELRQALLASAGSVCPYCGLDRPTTLDHYVPKTDYPEFAVFPPNLIPSCGVCNNRKGTAWRETRHRLFLHAYYDRIPAGCVGLVADIEWLRKGPIFKFRLNRNRQIPRALFRIVETHTERLQLLEWYAKRAEEEFDDFDVIPEQTDQEQLKRLVQRTAARKRRREGPFSWRAALWDAVAADDDVLAFLRNRLDGK
jgi:hypothetical protein